MSFPQLGYPQYLSAAGPGAYGGERPGVLAAAAAAAASSGRPGPAELGAGAAAVTSVLGMYAAAGPYAGAPGYSAFLPYAADLGLFSQMVSARPALPRLLRRARGRESGGRGAGSGAAAAPRRRGPARRVAAGGSGEAAGAGPGAARCPGAPEPPLPPAAGSRDPRRCGCAGETAAAPGRSSHSRIEFIAGEKTG